MKGMLLWVGSWLFLFTLCHADQESSYPEQPQEEWNELADRGQRSGRINRRYENANTPRFSDRSNEDRNHYLQGNNRPNDNSQTLQTARRYDRAQDYRQAASSSSYYYSGQPYPYSYPTTSYPPTTTYPSSTTTYPTTYPPQQ